MTMQPQSDYIKAITELAAGMPLTRTVQLYEFALFLKTHSLPAEETIEAIAADEALWEAKLAATDEDKLDKLIASFKEEIKAGKTYPMFDEHGEFIERQ